MELHRTARGLPLQAEYGLRGSRLLPWDGLNIPFGGAYCVVDPHTETLRHVNDPADEEELFICIEGRGTVVVGEKRFSAEAGDVFVMPCGVPHHVHNDNERPFVFYALWWNRGTVVHYLNTRRPAVAADYEI